MAQQSNPSHEMMELITLDEAARLRGVTRPAISYLVKTGRIRSREMFGRVLVFQSEVMSYKKQKPGPKPIGKETAKKRGSKKK